MLRCVRVGAGEVLRVRVLLDGVGVCVRADSVGLGPVGAGVRASAMAGAVGAGAVNLGFTACARAGADRRPARLSDVPRLGRVVVGLRGALDVHRSELVQHPAETQ